MKEKISLLGLLIFFAGVTVAYSNPITYYVPTIYPYAMDGAIIALIGLVTIIIGFAMPESKATEKV